MARRQQLESIKSISKCPKCNASGIVKDGFSKNKQRYLCKVCHYHFTTKSILNMESEKGMKRKALILYLEGYSFRAIADLLNISHTTVQNWIKEHGKDFKKIRSKEAADLIVTEGVINENILKATPDDVEGRTKIPYTWLIIGIDTFNSFMTINTEEEPLRLRPRSANASQGEEPQPSEQKAKDDETEKKKENETYLREEVFEIY